MLLIRSSKRLRPLASMFTSKQLSSRRTIEIEHQKTSETAVKMNFNRSKNSDIIPNLMNFMMQEPPPPPPIVANCGELRTGHAGAYVEMTGRLIKKRSSRFAEIRDRCGATQLLINEEMYPKTARRFSTLQEDSIITIFGRVLARPNSYWNESLQTGGIEVEVERVISSGPPPHKGGAGLKRSYSTMTAADYKGITSTEYKRAVSDSMRKYFENREITCNDLSLKDIGKNVQLVGWIQNVGNGKFQQLRDGYGQTQIIGENPRTFYGINERSIVFVEGKVVARPQANRNTSIATGEIEVIIEKIKVLDPSSPYDGPIKEKPQKHTPNIKSTDAKETQETTSIHEYADVNSYTNRTHNCAELTIADVDKEVVLCGWLEFQRMDRFIILRDGYGKTQVVLSPEVGELDLTDIPLESIVQVEGIVIPRPSNNRNPGMKTGDIEVNAKKIHILNEATKNLPIEVRSHNRSKEALRMEYRYIDLRFPDMQRNLRMRSALLMKMREFLINRAGFVEVETPTLFRRTPGGAQEFVVPTRNHGHFYSLVQSPQQFKQMLMAGAIDRYFQIARCYRDEATRPDRQPEFTQLDVELSFTSRESIMQLIEDLLTHCLPADSVAKPFARLTYNEAMEKYGSDKPDTRFDMTFTNVTKILASNESLVKEIKDFGAYAILVKKLYAHMSTALKKNFEEQAKTSSSKLVYHIMNKPTIEEWSKDKLSNLLSADVMQTLGTTMGIETGDLLFLTFGENEAAQKLLGRVRLSFVQDLENRELIPKRKEEPYNFLWITDFPMFCKSESDPTVLESTHHPFTAPHEDDRKYLKSSTKDLEKIRSQAYDLVLNGQEIGGGSIRIHDHAEQLYVLEEILKIPHEHLQHLLQALKSGCPPHGGIALGIDRLMSIICQTNSIRDVIAFPKGMDGKDHLSKAPVPISDEEKKLYGLIPSDAATSKEDVEAQ